VPDAPTPSADVSVRPATPQDADAVGQVQARAWRSAYADVLPPAVLAGLMPEALAEQWRDAVTAPPSPRHRLLVAVAGGRVVGFAASAPATDPDLDPDADAELLVLLVDPEAGRAGHGSRLLAATVDLVRSDGARRAVAWLPAVDAATRELLVSSGWAPDTATRELETGHDALPQVRLHTDLSA
jgi:GNAT superfamily N-acetyltransferase